MHEYGHHIDGNLDKTKIYASTDQQFKSAMAADSARLVRDAGHGRESKALAARKAAIEQAYRAAAAQVAEADLPGFLVADGLKRHGLDYADTLSSLRKDTVFATTLKGDELAQRMARIVTAFDLGDAQGLLDALLGKGDWKEVSRAGSLGICGKLSDLIGSITRNKVAGYKLSGWGHSSAYYRRNSEMAGTETWANLTCLYGEGSLFWQKVIERFTPESNRVFLEMMKDE